MTTQCEYRLLSALMYYGDLHPVNAKPQTTKHQLPSIII